MGRTLLLQSSHDPEEIRVHFYPISKIADTYACSARGSSKLILAAFFLKMFGGGEASGKMTWYSEQMTAACIHSCNTSVQL